MVVTRHFARATADPDAHDSFVVGSTKGIIHEMEVATLRYDTVILRQGHHELEGEPQSDKWPDITRTVDSFDSVVGGGGLQV